PRSGNLQGKRYRTLQVGLYHRASVGLEHSQTGHLVDTHAAPGPGAAAHAVGIHMADMRLRTATRPNPPITPPSHDAVPLPVQISLGLHDLPATGISFGSLKHFPQRLVQRLAVRPLQRLP